MYTTNFKLCTRPDTEDYLLLFIFVLSFNICTELFIVILLFSKVNLISPYKVRISLLYIPTCHEIYVSVKTGGYNFEETAFTSAKVFIPSKEHFAQRIGVS